MLRKLLFGFASAVVFAAILPARMNAQEHDCGLNCTTCGDNKWEGTSHSPQGPYNMMCIGPAETGGCDLCPSRAANTRTIAAIAIAKAIQSATSRELTAIHAAYGNRLLINTARNVVAVRGTACDPTRVAVVIYLTPSKVNALAELGVPELRKYLALKSATGRTKV